MNLKRANEIIKRKLDFDSIWNSLTQELGTKVGVARRPQYKESHVMILLDVSSSMNEGDKLNQAKSGCRGFSEEMITAGFSLGIITFSTTTTEILKLTRNLPEVHDAVNHLTASGSTNMADAISHGMDTLQKWESRRMLLLITDGMPDDKKKTIRMAKEAKRAGIEIHTHGTQDADEDFLRTIASNKEIVMTVPDHLLGESIRQIAGTLKQLPPA